VAAEGLDVDAADVDEVLLVLPAPGGELAQVQRVGLAGEAAVASQEPEKCRLLELTERRLVHAVRWFVTARPFAGVLACQRW
jgi:hypothetical protein